MVSATQTRLPKRQVLLFLLVLATPCLVLTGLGLRIREQERDLAQRHEEEERQQQMSQFRSELLSVLERVKLQATQKRGHDAVLVAAVREGQLMLPFATETYTRRVRQTLQKTAFGVRMETAEHEELIAHRLEKAAELYRTAVTESRLPWERAYAGLLLARTLQKAGEQTEARKCYNTILQAPVELTDEYGIPLALYAASPLLEARAGRGDIIQLLRRFVDDPHMLSPPALHRIRELAAGLGDTGLIPTVDRLIADSEQSEALQADFPRLLARLPAEDPVWIPYGEPVWLVSLAVGVGETEPVLVAVDAARVRELLGRSAQTVRLVQNKEGELLGASFPSLRAVFPDRPPQNGSLRSAFLTLALGLVMALTLLAGYLLWRDMRRDAHLAELRSHFVSSVSHELRTPLTSIRMFTESLRMDDEIDPQSRDEYLDTILRESERLSRLVDNMLHFARIEQGRAGYDLRPASLKVIAATAVRSFAHPAEESGFELHIEAPPDLPPVLADRDALQQAILNLLGNALKYSGSSREIALRLEREDGRAAIHVIDHGVGIAAEEQARIFERFYRVPTPENQQIPGTGLGLTLVSHIAAAHGGSVSVKSAPELAARLPSGFRLRSTHEPNPGD